MTAASCYGLMKQVLQSGKPTKPSTTTQTIKQYRSQSRLLKCHSSSQIASSSKPRHRRIKS